MSKEKRWPILILDSHDLHEWPGGVSVSDFLKILRTHTDNIGKSDDEIFAHLRSEPSLPGEPDEPILTFYIKDKK